MNKFDQPYISPYVNQSIGFFPSAQCNPHMDSSPSCRMLVAAPQVFTMQNPAPYQPMSEVPPDVAQYCGAVANAVGNEMLRARDENQGNPTFTYFINTVLMERYAGPVWFNALGYATMLLWKAIMEYPGSDIPTLIHQTAYAAVTHKAAVLSQQNPQVMAHVTPDVGAKIMDATRKHSINTGMFLQMAGNYQRGAQILATPQSAAQHYGGVVGAALTSGVQTAQPTGDYNPFGVTINNGENTPLANQEPAGMTQIDFTKVFMKMPDAKPTETKRKGVMFSMTEGVVDGSEPVQKPVAAVAPVVLEDVPVVSPAPRPPASMPPSPPPEPVHETRVFATEAEWRPFEGQLYLPAYNWNIHKLVFERVQTAQWGERVVAFVEMLTEEEMEERKHQIPRVFRGSVIPTDPVASEAKVEKINRDLELMAAALAAKNKAEKQEQTEKFQSNELATEAFEVKEEAEIHANGESDFISQCRMNALTQQSEKPELTRADVARATFVTKKSLEHFFQLFEQAPSLVEGLRALKKYAQDHKEDPDYKIGFDYLNRFVSEEVEFILRKRMGLNEMWLDDAVNDIEPMQKYLHDEFGAAFSKAWKEYEPVLFENIKDSLKYIQEIKDSSDQETVGYAQQFTRSSALVLLDMTAHEFGVLIHGNQTHHLHDSMFPGLALGVKNFIDHAPGCMRMYIALKDKVYSVHRSIMGDKSAVIFDEGLFA